MSQISIGLKNTSSKKGWAPTVKKPRYNVKKENFSIQSSTISTGATQHQLQDSVVIRKLKFWQLVQWFVLVTVFVTSITSLLISIYIIASKQSQSREEVSVDIKQLRTTMRAFDDRLTKIEDNAVVQEMNKSLSELKAALDLSSITHERYYRQLNDTIFRAVESVGTVNPSNELDLTAGCSVDTITCAINHNNVQGRILPTKESCETDPVALEVEGVRNVNIYCSINNNVGEVNPITSTLNIYNAEVSCLCNLVALTSPTGSPECILTIHRCPETIRLNTTSIH